MNELATSNDSITDSAELQRRIEEDGYLFFRQLLDADRLMTLRREMLELMQQGGWLVAGTDPIQGIANIDARSTEGDPRYTDVYHQVYRLQSFHAIAHSPVILDVLQRVTGSPMLPLPQKVARLWFPKFTQHTTPTHQDFVHFQGSLKNLTCWSPVGECPRELGGLALLKGSHKGGQVLDHHFSLGAGSLNLDVESHPELNGLEWLTTDYQIGDTLIFPALTIHQALPNITENRLRVSLDNRYQRIGDPVAEHMLTPHLSTSNALSWEEVYEGWNDDSLKYYWKRHENPVHPTITRFSEAAFNEAVALAIQGNEAAVLHLQRIAARNDRSQKLCSKATRVLAEIGKPISGGF